MVAAPVEVGGWRGSWQGGAREYRGSISTTGPMPAVLTGERWNVYAVVDDHTRIQILVVVVDEYPNFFAS